MASLLARIGSRIGRAIAAPVKYATQPFRARVPATVMVGVPGYAVDGGYLRSGERDSDLRGRQKHTTYSNAVLNTAIVGAGYRLHVDLAGRAELRCKPPKAVAEKPEAQEWAEKMDAIFADMATPMRQVQRRAAGSMFNGSSWQAWHVKRGVRGLDEGVLGIADVAPRPNSTIERYEVDEYRRLLGMWQRDPQDGREVPVPRSRCLYMVDQVLDDSPEGVGLFRHVVEDIRWLRRLEQLEGIGFEQDLAGIPIARYPAEELDALMEQDPERYDAAWKATQTAGIEEFLANHTKGPGLGLQLSSQPYANPDKTLSSIMKWSLEIVNAQAAGQAIIGEAIMRRIKMVAILLGVEGLLVGMDHAGAYALAEEKMNQLLLRVESLLKDLAYAIRRDLVEPIWVLNAWPMEYMPDVEFDKLVREDVEKAARVLVLLSQAGLEHNDGAINEIRGRVGVPPAPEPDPAVLAAMAAIREQAEVDRQAAAGGTPPGQPGDPGPPGAGDQSPRSGNPAGGHDAAEEGVPGGEGEEDDDEPEVD